MEGFKDGEEKRGGRRSGLSGAEVRTAPAGDPVLAELRGLRCDVRELIDLVRQHQARPPPQPLPIAEPPKELPPLMTIADTAVMMRTTTRALYRMIARGHLPGVVRVGSRKLMVKTAELMKRMRDMPYVT